MIRMARQLMSISTRPALLIGVALMLLVAAPVSGQSNPPQEQKQEPAKAEPAKAPATGPSEPDREGQIMAPTQNAESPRGDGFTLGAYQGHADVEIGYRWASDVSGNQDVYRSMVNLGSGPKLLRSNFSLRSNYGAGTLFDRMDVSANSWGGDPYNTLRINVGLSDKYEFRANYRNLNYYNYLPQYSNPLLARGILFGQHSLNVTYRSSDFELRLFPNSRIRPFVGYMRSSGFGPGFTTTEFTGNEFLVQTNWRYNSDDYRGGVEISLPKSVVTIEQGYRILRNDTGVESDANPGNNPSARFLGNPVFLSSLSRGYHDRTTLPFTKLVGKFTPFHNLRFTGRYIYSMADLDASYGEVAAGGFVNLTERLVYRAGLDNFDTHARRPDHNGSFLVEFSPFSRLTLQDEFESRNTHTSGSAVLASIFFGAHSLAGPGGPTSDTNIRDLANTILVFNRLRNLAEAEFDLGWGFGVRGGYRYTNADASVGDSEEGEAVEPDSSSYKQNTGIVGVTYRRARWLRLGLDYEKNETTGTLTRTDLLNYDQFRFSWRLGSWHHFSTTGKIWGLRNSNNQEDIDFHSHNRNYSVELNYDPTERLNFSVDYSKSSIFSDISILLPQTLQLDRSLFDERTHGVGGSMGVGIYRGSRVDFGYRGIFNGGTAPLNFHQPFAEITVPMPNRLAFKTYWQYFGYNEKAPFSGTMINQNPRGFQDFHTHLVTFSIAYLY